MYEACILNMLLVQTWKKTRAHVGGGFYSFRTEQILSKLETVQFKDAKEIYNIIMGILVSYVP